MTPLPALVCGALAIALGLAVASCDHVDSDSTNKINGSVHMPAGKPAEALATVNGSIRLDDNAAATSASTVNGGVRLGAHSTSESVNSVNGSITVEEGARVADAVSTVNGAITIKQNAEIGGNVSNVNGTIELASAQVHGNLKTASGDIHVLGTSHVEGGVSIEKPGNELIHFTEHVPIVIIGPGASVRGEMRFERKVELYVSDKATVGTVTGATVIPFTGETPPR